MSVTAGTIFHSTKLPLKVWFLAIYHVSQSKGGISSAELGRRLGVREATAWLMKQKIMAAMQTREEAKPKLKGRVEMDDAYLGGVRSGGKRGRGAAGKTPFIAAVETTIERRPRRIKLKTVKGFRKKEVERFAKTEIEPKSSAVSDGLSCWPAVERRPPGFGPMSVMTIPLPAPRRQLSSSISLAIAAASIQPSTSRAGKAFCRPMPMQVIRQDFFLARRFRNLDDLNAQFSAWLAEIANPRRGRSSPKPLPSGCRPCRRSPTARQSLYRPGQHQAPHGRSPDLSEGDPHLRGRQADRMSSGPARQASKPPRSQQSPGAAEAASQ